MPYRVNASTALKTPSKYYHKVICSCFNRKGEAQVLVWTEVELKDHEQKFGRQVRITDDEYRRKYG